MVIKLRTKSDKKPESYQIYFSCRHGLSSHKQNNCKERLHFYFINQYSTIIFCFQSISTRCRIAMSLAGSQVKICTKRVDIDTMPSGVHRPHSAASNQCMEPNHTSCCLYCVMLIDSWTHMTREEQHEEAAVAGGCATTFSSLFSSPVSSKSPPSS